MSQVCLENQAQLRGSILRLEIRDNQRGGGGNFLREASDMGRSL